MLVLPVLLPVLVFLTSTKKACGGRTEELKRGHFGIGGSRKLKTLKKDKERSLLILREEFVPGRRYRCMGLEAACLSIINIWFSIIGIKGEHAHFGGGHYTVELRHRLFVVG